MTLSKLVEYMHCQKSRKSINFNAEWSKKLKFYTISKPWRSGKKSKVSSHLTCNSKYFPQVYQSTTPWQVPFIIVNIIELLKLILEEVLSKYMDAAEDTKEDVKEEANVDVAEEEDTSNVTSNP